MAYSPLIQTELAPARADGRDDDLLGPSDSSDSGSDATSPMPLDAEEPGLPEDGLWRARSGGLSDAAGTGERGASDGLEPEAGADILPDRVFSVGADGRRIDDPLDDDIDLQLDLPLTEPASQP